MRAIIEAAARILEEGGLEAFSTNAVADRAGVSVGSLYQYFPGKEALIRALIVRETAQLLAEAEASTLEPTGKRALAVLIEACIRHQFRRPALARLLDFEEARLPLDPEIEATGDRFTRLIAVALAKPDLPCRADPEIAAQDIMAMIKGMVDAAGFRRETHKAGLAARVGRAVAGYLGQPVA